MFVFFLFENLFFHDISINFSINFFEILFDLGNGNNRSRLTLTTKVFLQETEVICICDESILVEIYFIEGSDEHIVAWLYCDEGQAIIQGFYEFIF